MFLISIWHEIVGEDACHVCGKVIIVERVLEARGELTVGGGCVVDLAGARASEENLAHSGNGGRHESRGGSVESMV